MGEWSPPTNDCVDALRTLALSQDYLSAEDISHLYFMYQGFPKGAELMLNLDFFYIDSSEADNTKLKSPFLATALRESVQCPGWEPIIRRLLRQGVNPNTPISVRRKCEPDYEHYLRKFSCKLPLFSTPLDELFHATHDPSESQRQSKRWLGILDEEGIDVMEYIKIERALHASQAHFTWSTLGRRIGEAKTNNLPRQLKYELGRNPPAVYWEWWINPKSPALLVLEEFKWMTAFQSTTYSLLNDPRTFFWPFDGIHHKLPLLASAFWQSVKEQNFDRSDIPMICELFGRVVLPHLVLEKQRRLERQASKKAKKLARANGRRIKSTTMPGSWAE